MGTRYYWEKYEKRDYYTDGDSERFEAPLPVGSGSFWGLPHPPPNQYGKYVGISPDDGSPFNCYILSDGSAMYRSNSSEERLSLSNGSLYTTGTGMHRYIMKITAKFYTTGAGSLIGYATSTSSSTYPSNAASGSYWYTYRGSDNIDPSAVSYSNTNPESGTSITISVSKRYGSIGGSIYYQYQYSTNGGSTWTTITSSTTSTSRSVTIPKGSKQFMARVRASDGYGYTSTTYVSGANLTVINKSNGSAGVSGTVKDITCCVCVGGAVKTNVSVYHGVNGTVKQS